MDYNSIKWIRENGFLGFEPITSIRPNKLVQSKKMGVYLILAPESFTPKFVPVGTGGWFKGKDPNVKITILKEKYVPGARVLYIGKAGASHQKTHLKRRLNDYLKFGEEKPVAHQGGRYIWQLGNWNELHVCWKELLHEEPEDVEGIMLAQFYDQFGKLPFANIRDDRAWKKLS